jgi:hypothetical protein
MALSRKNVSLNRNCPEIHHLRSMEPRMICVSRKRRRASARFGCFRAGRRARKASSKASSERSVGCATHTVRGYLAEGGQPLAVVFFVLPPSYMWY